jgi:hypothetical protein
MKENEIYWLNLYNEGLIKIDFNNGVVYSYLNRGKEHVLGERTKAKNKNLYLRSSAGPTRKERYQILLHRLIWIVANGDIPKDIEINHKNGIKYDNRLENLELTDKRGNALHSYRVLGNKGGTSKGESSPMAKLTKDKVVEMREKYATGNYNLRDIAIEYNMSDANTAFVITGRTWKDCSGPISERPGRGKQRIRRKDSRIRKLNNQQIDEIKLLLKEGNFLHREIAEKYNISRGYVTSINRNRI